ncbi:DPP IV N-terminal domain-containing protein [Flavobacterium sp. NKUCC04_CG]|uniref:S9 family peptidase n=1 Tax=Flavobacterium sp. NKUCC04_CG TaxID=2842121 RepID=UPI001C5BDD00|nr:DPP IV N-terminal domain-containing protein [Flavobacterium sp. NKUCC04_CG]MBW3518652.1 DPP IV N-terminal domain-containing protein [Flavobacterium sp. NKUCC04_CG]
MRKTSLLVFLLAGHLLFAQRNLTIEEATSGNFTKFAPKTITAPQWQDQNQLSYLDATYQNLMSRNQSNKWKETVLISKADLQSAIDKTLNESGINLRIFPYAYTWKDAKTLTFTATGKDNMYHIEYDLASKKISNFFKLDKLAKNQIVSSKGNYMAWLNDNNIVISDRNEKNTAITNDPALDIINGSNDTHRQEFGIDRGMWWNPTKDQLLYYRKDQSMVSSYPLVNFGARVAEVKNIKYPMAGMTSEQVTLVVYDIKTQKKVTLQTGEPKEQFLTMVTWDPKGEYVYVGLLNREQNHIQVNRYNATTGLLDKKLFEDKSNTYAEPSHALTFVPNKNNEFLYLTEKDGFRQIYLYNTDGKELKKLGYKDVVVKEILGFDATGKTLYYVGTSNRGLDRQLYQVSLANQTTELLTTLSGTHNIQMNENKTAFLDQFSNTTTPNEISIVDTKTKKAVELVKSPNPYEGTVTLPKMEMVTITAADGQTPLNGRLIYPANFDATKKYPVMVYVYGGPHAQLVQNKWLGGASLFDYYMAQNGYVVFTVDNRGSDNRGRDFEHVIHRKLGENEMADQLKGIEFLKSKAFVDADKIGVYGWSFGGFMTTTLSINHPEIFKVGVAGGPVMDWKYYEIMYGERYMDTPQENPEGYEKTSLINKADKLNNRLLVIHGAQDPVVVQQHSMEFIEACIKAGKQVDYFLYPTHEHNVSGKDRVHLNQKIADYFFTHLQRPSVN